MLKRIGQFLIAVVVIIAVFAFWVFLQIPSDREIKGCLVTKMYHVKLCPGSKDYVPLSQISSFMPKAVVMSEDTLFWTHHGFDWEEMQKSAEKDWRRGEYKRGGSTISQQLAKNMFLSKDKSLIRKGLEALITLRIEKVLTKKEILERYLNVVEFGKDLFGIKAAAKFYFKKSAADLNLVESAFLTMLLPSPEKYARSYFKKSLTPFARGRIAHIMGDLSRTGHVTVQDYDVGLSQIDGFLGSRPAADLPPITVSPSEVFPPENPPPDASPPVQPIDDSEFDPHEGEE